MTPYEEEVDRKLDGLMDHIMAETGAQAAFLSVALNRDTVRVALAAENDLPREEMLINPKMIISSLESLCQKLTPNG